MFRIALFYIEVQQKFEYFIPDSKNSAQEIVKYVYDFVSCRAKAVYYVDKRMSDAPENVLMWNDLPANMHREQASRCRKVIRNAHLGFPCFFQLYYGLNLIIKLINMVSSKVRFVFQDIFYLGKLKCLVEFDFH
ncbi:unnamed protein product [Acanthoscelides obtectus]|uniref:Uncharacterized protein n=1 Tax=Acanthoscelides obtectus TaxID=200917 RepID=A0A9P0PLP4_ACAOB|nr:unnamed protein product [Acanthoscelides obtectus]CAK1654618.1 hypothetical protein AOBTE_LOCUS18718 [Acanthoscelides obtectus]